MRILVIILAYLSVVPCQARTISVDDDGPADYASIQAAIIDANDGDVIVVQPGTYIENINYYGRAVTVTSTDPNDPSVVAATVIQYASYPPAAVTFDCGEVHTTCSSSLASLPTSLDNPLLYIKKWAKED